MAAATFQIRVCQNPSCGLRYPLVRSHSFGERCPACLGDTLVAFEGPLGREGNMDNDPPRSEIRLSVLLDNVRSAWNVGSILRSADGFEFIHAYFCGITPTPETPAVRKTALGAETTVPWSVHKNAVELAGRLRSRGATVWALEKKRGSTPIQAADFSKSDNDVLIVGNELSGIDPGLLEIADHIVHLPMYGRKRSFNVAVAFALAAQSMRARN
jgi:23S rRNA (guanosine2251-2'-O)-methyltransferase